jgi:hypothetical protein
LQYSFGQIVTKWHYHDQIPEEKLIQNFVLGLKRKEHLRSLEVCRLVWEDNIKVDIKTVLYQIEE